MQVILYPTETGVAIIVPSGAMPIAEIAKKDVPSGVPFLIADQADIPADRTFRDAWESDFTHPHGIGMGPDEWFAQQRKKAASK